MLDAIWEQIIVELRAPFTTQRFREAVEGLAPDVWKAMTDKWGPGGKGSGNFYSPANPLYNYLNKKALAGELVKHGYVPSLPGWGTNKVMQFDFARTKEIPASEEDVAFVEGAQRQRTHLVRERASGLRDRLLASRAAAGLSCDICQTTGISFPSEIRNSIFEAHHDSEPLSAGDEKETRVKDLALLCASCHRALHKLVSVKGAWLTVSQVREVLR